MNTAEIINLDLAREVREINALHAQHQTTLAIAIEIGRRLLAVKASLPHGQFMPWVKANCTFSERHARRYMACGKTDSVSVLPEAPTTIREAAKRSAKPPADKPQRVGWTVAVDHYVGDMVPPVFTRRLPQSEGNKAEAICRRLS